MNPKRETERKAVEECFFQDGSLQLAQPALLGPPNHSRCSHQGTPTSIKESTTDLPTGQSYGGIISINSAFPQICLGFVSMSFKHINGHV